jgi:tetratricopeptide (TPR) repeat protein
MPAERALDILSEHPLTKQEALPDIEHLRRSLESTPPDRVVAETWLLLNRHPEAPDIYRWAAWYFEHQRRYEDLDALRHFAVQNHVESPFLTFHYALRLVRNGDMKKGAELLESGAAPLSWQRYANIALVLDAGHEYAAALKYYEDAAALIPGDAKAATHADAAKIYLKLARCRRILGGKPDEIRRDLERAFTLDRENVDVRLALRRMS